MSEDSSAEEMPCPRCKKMHQRGPYVKRPDLKEPKHEGVPVCPADVWCDCGATLRHFVPIFMMDRYGWHWEIVSTPS
jgi:hypothetical protein